MKIKSISRNKKEKIIARKLNLIEQLNSILPFCKGNIHKEFRTCGNSNCKCKKDKSQRHGPYYVWSTKEGNKTKRYTLRLEQAEHINMGIARYEAFKTWINKFESTMKSEYLSSTEWQMTDLSKKKRKSRKRNQIL